MAKDIKYIKAVEKEVEKKSDFLERYYEKIKKGQKPTVDEKKLAEEASRYLVSLTKEAPSTVLALDPIVQKILVKNVKIANAKEILFTYKSTDKTSPYVKDKNKVALDGLLKIDRNSFSATDYITDGLVNDVEGYDGRNSLAIKKEPSNRIDHKQYSTTPYRPNNLHTFAGNYANGSSVDNQIKVDSHYSMSFTFSLGRFGQKVRTVHKRKYNKKVGHNTILPIAAQDKSIQYKTRNAALINFNYDSTHTDGTSFYDDKQGPGDVNITFSAMAPFSNVNWSSGTDKNKYPVKPNYRGKYDPFSICATISIGNSRTYSFYTNYKYALNTSYNVRFEIDTADGSSMDSANQLVIHMYVNEEIQELAKFYGKPWLSKWNKLKHNGCIFDNSFLSPLGEDQIMKEWDKIAYPDYPVIATQPGFLTAGVYAGLEKGVTLLYPSVYHSKEHTIDLNRGNISYLGAMGVLTRLNTIEAAPFKIEPRLKTKFWKIDRGIDLGKSIIKVDYDRTKKDIYNSKLNKINPTVKVSDIVIYANTASGPDKKLG